MRGVSKQLTRNARRDAVRRAKVRAELKGRAKGRPRAPVGSSLNPARLDPSRTGQLRIRAAAAVRARYDRLRTLLWQRIVLEDALGLGGGPGWSWVHNAGDSPGNCGTGAGGFRPGNTCAGGGGSHRQLTGPEQYAVSSYKNTGYNYVNSTLREKGFDALAPSAKEQVRTLDRLVEGSPVPTDAVLHRVIDGKRVGDRYLKVGAVIEDKAFASTSTDQGKAMRAVEDAAGGRVKTATTLEVRVPKGYPAFDLQAHTVGGAIFKPQLDEGEYLLPRGTKLRVVSADKDKRHAVVEVVWDGPTANALWDLLPTADKLRAFGGWLKDTAADLWRGLEENLHGIADLAIRKGAGRSYDEARAGHFLDPNFRAGARDQFLDGVLRDPSNRERFDALKKRIGDELTNHRDSVVEKVERSISDAVIQQKSPTEAWKEITTIVDREKDSATTTVHDEVVREHAEGQVAGFEEAGVAELFPRMEWTVHPQLSKSGTCPRCWAMRGTRWTIEEARGKIPLHRNCRCTWSAVDPEDRRKRSYKPAPNRYLPGTRVKFRPGKKPKLSRNVEGGGGNCGTGAGGFKPGNRCAVGSGPPVDKGKRVPNPIPATPHDLENKIENALSKYAHPDTVKEFIKYSATEETVNISALTSPQRVNDPSAVKHFKDNPHLIEGHDPLPLVIQYGTHMFLRDGNSRTTAAMELGRGKIKVRVVYVPEG